jgi:hypothetical protein
LLATSPKALCEPLFAEFNSTDDARHTQGIVNPCLLSHITDIARHIAQGILNPCLLIQIAAYDAASNICQANCPPRHATHLIPRLLS